MGNTKIEHWKHWQTSVKTKMGGVPNSKEFATALDKLKELLALYEQKKQLLLQDGPDYEQKLSKYEPQYAFQAACERGDLVPSRDEISKDVKHHGEPIMVQVKVENGKLKKYIYRTDLSKSVSVLGSSGHAESAIRKTCAAVIDDATVVMDPGSPSPIIPPPNADLGSFPDEYATKRENSLFSNKNRVLWSVSEQQLKL